MHKFFAKTQFLGKKVLFLSQCHSTNDVAGTCIKENTETEGTTIITQDQTNGRGQRGNTWESEPGMNATFSVILKPTIIPAQKQFQLHILTTLAIHAVLSPILGNDLKIKWPNDIYYKDRKLGGLLIENMLKGQFIEWSIIGIGLNINQIIFTNQMATSLQELTGEEFEINSIIEQILIELEKKYIALKHGDFNMLKSQYLRRLYLYQEESKFKSDDGEFSGIITGVNPSGQLQVQEGNKTHHFAFKEVSFV